MRPHSATPGACSGSSSNKSPPSVEWSPTACARSCFAHGVVEVRSMPSNRKGRPRPRSVDYSPRHYHYQTRNNPFDAECRARSHTTTTTTATTAKTTSISKTSPSRTVRIHDERRLPAVLPWDGGGGDNRCNERRTPEAAAAAAAHSTSEDDSSSSCSSSSSSSPPASFDCHREALCKRYHFSISCYAAKANPREEAAAAAIEASVVHPEKTAMKRHRRDKTATSMMVGASVGTLILPVVGTVVGGFLSGYAANQSLKRHERKVQRKWERDQFQRDASASYTKHAVFV